MADRPILFSGPMVRALLAGTKTQTRRYLDADSDEPVAVVMNGVVTAFDERERPYRWQRTHAVGDRLYVREHWRSSVKLDYYKPAQIVTSELPFNGVPIYYSADDAVMIDTEIEGLISLERAAKVWPDLTANGKIVLGAYSAPGKARISLHMPREFSRITLTVTDVRVQRLQDISEEDARAEGVDFNINGGPNNRAAYCRLWNTLHGAGSWEANPFVAAYSFTVALHNIDQEISA